MDVLSVCRHQYPLLRCGVLGRQHDKEGFHQAGQADQADRLCGQHEAELFGYSSRDKNTKRTAGNSGQWQPSYDNQRGLFSDRLLLTKSNTNRLNNSFVPRAIKLYNSIVGGRGRGRTQVITPQAEEEV